MNAAIMSDYETRISDRQQVIIDIINFTIMMGLFHNFFQ